MNIIPNHIFHVYNRGNQTYCSILAYCLMPNHFHFLIYANENTVAPAKALHRENQLPKVGMNNFSHGMKMLLSSYTKAINKQRNLTGSLFVQNTKAKQVSSKYAQEDY